MALQETISSILIELQSHWERLNKSQISQWTAYADYRFLIQSGISESSFPLMGGPRGAFILQNFYRVFYGPLNGLGKNPIMQVPVFTPPESMDIWGPKGEWSNKDIIRYPVALNIKTHFAIIWESAPIPESLPLSHADSHLRLMKFTTLNGRDQDTTIPYHEQFGRIPKAGEYILAKVGFANKLTGFVSNLVTLKQKVKSK